MAALLNLSGAALRYSEQRAKESIRPECWNYFEDREIPQQSCSEFLSDRIERYLFG
jgi:hypothetical protein